RDLDSYSRQAARNACAEYLRDRFPLRALLKNRLRRIFRNRTAFAEWELDGELVCGYAGWRNRREYAPNSAQIARALADPASLAPDAHPRKGFDQLHISDWEWLLESALDALGCAIELDDLVSILAPRLGVKDVPVQTGAPAEDDSDALESAEALQSLVPRADPNAELHLRELLTALWQSLLRMDARKRCAFLLNPPTMEIELLPAYGVARIADIAKSLALTDAQFDAIWEALPLSPEARSIAAAQTDATAKFAALWNFLPLQDSLIAELLGLTQQQVINQRMLARRVLSRELAGFLSRGTK
ncbi:MAG: hypothetical protein ACRD5L_09170, partial [Bryobacteraceae bacterium]